MNFNNLIILPEPALTIKYRHFWVKVETCVNHSAPGVRLPKRWGEGCGCHTNVWLGPFCCSKSLPAVPSSTNPSWSKAHPTFRAQLKALLLHEASSIITSPSALSVVLHPRSFGLCSPQLKISDCGWASWQWWETPRDAREDTPKGTPVPTDRRWVRT